MTAPTRYQKLEATGRYVETPEAPPREVVVAFGAASLTIIDMNDTPLAHWPIATLTRVDGLKGALTLAPDVGAGERLVIADEEMAKAIREASRGLAEGPRRARRRRVRRVTFAAAALAALAGAVFYAPRALEGVAAATPLAARAALGDAAIERFSRGRVCDPPAARRALDRLGAQLGLPPGSLVAVDAPSPEGVAALAAPGERVVIFRSTLRNAPDARAVAAAAAAAAAGAARRPPTVIALSEAGFRGLLDAAAGGPADSALVGAAARLLREGRPTPDAEGGAALMRSRGLDEPAEPLLPPESWDALQRACEP